MSSTSCNICGKPKSAFVMNNKTVCMRCDELLFDLEIECDEPEVAGAAKDKGASKSEVPKKVLNTIKKTP